MPQRPIMEPAEDAPPLRRSARIRVRNEAASRAAQAADNASGILGIAMPSHAINGPRGRQLNRPTARARNQSNRQETNLALQNLLETNGVPPATPPLAVETSAVAVAPISPVMPPIVPFSQLISPSMGTAREMPPLVPLSPMQNSMQNAESRPQTSRQLSGRGAADRIRRELQSFWNEPPDGCKVDVEKDIFRWKASITGPENTPYEGGVFHLVLLFDEQYPYTPPKVSFLTKIYHCNISSATGIICLDILNYQWSPALTVGKVLLSIISLLADPNPDDPLELPLAELYKQNQEAYEAKARLWTSHYAVPDPEEQRYR